MFMNQLGNYIADIGASIPSDIGSIARAIAPLDSYADIAAYPIRAGAYGAGAFGEGVRQAAGYAYEHPGQAAIGLGANALLGNPVGAVVDFSTLGLTNLRENEPNPNRRFTPEELESAKYQLQQQAAQEQIARARMAQQKN